jgi:signal transduction histidine kinase
MGAWAIADWQTGRALIRRFAVLSLIVIGLITLALSMIISHYLRKDLLEREWGVTADYVRTEILYHLTPSDFEAPRSKTAQEHFERFYEQTVMMPEIIRVKIYDAAGAVVWSDEPRLIGQRFPDNPHLVSALTGRTMVNLDPGEGKGENIYEPTESARLVEVYVPVVFPGTGRVAGVVETYKMPKKVFAGIRKGQLAVVSTAVAGGFLLYLSLFWIVRRAARRIDEQHQSLENRRRELTLANQELQAVQGQLVAAERMAAIGEVVTAVAHGIRNPLANIRASAQVASLDCRECAASSLAPRNLANIMAEVDRLEGRLRELLQFVRPAERHSGPLDLNTVLNESLEMMAGRIAKARLRLDKQLNATLPPIMGNAMILEQVFLSLIGNAIEAIPGGDGMITLTTGTTTVNGGTPAVFVEVRDTGIGIPPEDLAKIFEPFHTTKAQGTGLGLAIARKFTEAHGGTIAVTSRPGDGTTFRVTFPVHQEA